MNDPNESSPDQAVMAVRNLSMRFPVRGRGMFARRSGWIHAVNDVSFDIRPGEVLGLVGESGCGKSTLGRCLVRSLEPTDGQVLYRTNDGSEVDLALTRGAQMRRLQREIRMVFQDPFSSLNPRMTIAEIVGDPLVASGLARGAELYDRVSAALTRVGLSPDHMKRYPHTFSGGQRQRVNIARALITQPRLVIADEAVSALDVSVRAQILNLLRDLQEDLGLTYLFISHDMSVVENLCDRVAVMYLGRIVEVAETDRLFTAPQHPYTEALLSAVPRPDPRMRDVGSRIRLPDDFPDPANPPSGCFFHTRCPHADGDACVSTRPQLVENIPGHSSACHHTEDLTLAGVGEFATADESTP